MILKKAYGLKNIYLPEMVTRRKGKKRGELINCGIQLAERWIGKVSSEPSPGDATAISSRTAISIACGANSDPCISKKFWHHFSFKIERKQNL